MKKYFHESKIRVQVLMSIMVLTVVPGCSAPSTKEYEKTKTNNALRFDRMDRMSGRN